MTLPDNITYRYLLEKAWPIVLANAAVPLLGLVDTAVIGNVGSVEDLGAIAFGALIFSFVYWSFGFLRMGTTGFVAQAAGAGDEVEIRAILGRVWLLAVMLGLLLIVLQWPIGQLALLLLDGSASVEATTAEYFYLRIWGAPATLTGFVLMGVLVGLGDSKQLLYVQLFLNGLNIVLDVTFAGYLNLGARGIALGTVIAEWSTVVFASWLIIRGLQRRNVSGEPFWPWSRILDRQAMLRAAAANSDIMIRTLLMIFSFAFFINQSAQFGDVALAATHLLLQLISFSAFFLDGYAFVIESLVGTAKGKRDRIAFDVAVRRSTILALVTAIALALVIVLLGETLIRMLTDIPQVRQAAGSMRYMAAAYVLMSFAAFQLDGIFIGVSSTRQMRHAAFIAIACFLLLWSVLVGPFGFTGLWLAMIFYVVARAGALLLFYPQLRNSIGAQ